MPLDCLNKLWPDVQNCSAWNISTDKEIRTLESNSIPPYNVPPYCPFGIGHGYCRSPVQGNSTDCKNFGGLICPCKEGTEGCIKSTNVGDVVTPYYRYFEFPLNPDPTKEGLPRNMYDNDCLKSGGDDVQVNVLRQFQLSIDTMLK